MSSCPNCGFDLNESGSCAVCGYRPGEAATFDRRGEEEAAGYRAATGEGGEGHGTATLSVDVSSPLPARGRSGMLVAGLVTLCVAAAFGAFLVLKGARSDRAAAEPREADLVTMAPADEPLSAGEPFAAGGASGQAALLDASLSGGTPSNPYGILPLTGTKNDYSVTVYTDPGIVGLKAKRGPAGPETLDPPVYDITKRTDLPPVTSESAFVAWMLAHTDEQESFLKERWQRAEIALELGHITHARTLMGFLLTPREWFVRAKNIKRAYDNAALTIGYGQTISGPHLVARMTDFLNVRPHMKVLEIGTGSGYQSAFLSELSDYVYTIEIVKPLAKETDEIYRAHTRELPEYANIHRRTGDGYYGWPQAAPFDRIIVTCGIDHIPPELLRELKPGGIMVIPIGPPSGQTILRITKKVARDGTITLTREDIYHGRAKDVFVPFTAEGGGRHSLARDLEEN